MVIKSKNTSITKKKKKQPNIKKSKSKNKTKGKTVKHEIVNRGGYGCVLCPNLDPKNINKTQKDKVSKIIRAKKNKKSKDVKAIQIELNIGKFLKNIDQKQMYFLGADELSKIKRQIVHNKKKEMTQCFRRNNINIKNDDFYALKMEKGYPMRLCWGSPIWPGCLISFFAHNVQGLLVLTEKSNLLFADIKKSNMLITSYKKKNSNKIWLHPVFIDFSSEHVINSHRNSLDSFVRHWDFDRCYFTWPPEIVAWRFAQYFNGDVPTVLEELKQEWRKTMSLFKLSDTFDIYSYFLNGTDKDHMEIANGIEVIQNEINRQKTHKQSRIRIKISQHFMLWSLAAAYLPMLQQCIEHHHEINKRDRQRLEKFFEIVMGLLHPNPDKRDGCLITLKKLDKICDSPKGSGDEKYLVPIAQRHWNKMKKQAQKDISNYQKKIDLASKTSSSTTSTSESSTVTSTTTSSKSGSSTTRSSRKIGNSGTFSSSQTSGTSPSTQDTDFAKKYKAVETVKNHARKLFNKST